MKKIAYLVLAAVALVLSSCEKPGYKNLEVGYETVYRISGREVMSFIPRQKQ